MSRYRGPIRGVRARLSVGTIVPMLCCLRSSGAEKQAVPCSAARIGLDDPFSCPVASLVGSIFSPATEAPLNYWLLRLGKRKAKPLHSGHVSSHYAKGADVSSPTSAQNSVKDPFRYLREQTTRMAKRDRQGKPPAPLSQRPLYPVSPPAPRYRLASTSNLPTQVKSTTFNESANV